MRLADHARFLEGTEYSLSFVRNVVRGDFIAYHPEAAKILGRYQISGEDIGLSMGKIVNEGESEEVLTELARTWFEEHRAEVDSWLEGLRGKERPATLPEETLPVAYSLDKEELFLDLAIEFNLFRPAGTLPVEPVRRHMEDLLEEALAGEYAAISPDSSVWLNHRVPAASRSSSRGYESHTFLSLCIQLPLGKSPNWMLSGSPGSPRARPIPQTPGP